MVAVRIRIATGLRRQWQTLRTLARVTGVCAHAAGSEVFFSPRKNCDRLADM
jgi:hypothetical protein